MKDLVCEVSNLMEPLFRKKEIDFSIECPRDSVKMSCDGDRIKQVLINLVDNASKSFGKNDEERRTKRVCVRLNADTDRVTVEIEDNGIGIRKEDQERIFKLFSQGKVADQPRSGGIGLGLALSRYIVKKHQGTLAVKSQLGMGSRFIVTLPSVRTKSL